MLKEEIWKDIPGILNYQASTEGRIRGKKGILVPQEHKDGYLRVRLYKDGGQNNNRTNYRIHRLIGMTFLFPAYLEEDYIIHHVDGNKENNKLENLKLIFIKENNANENKLNNDLLICSYNWKCPLGYKDCRHAVKHKKINNCTEYKRCLDAGKKYVLVKCKKCR